LLDTCLITCSNRRVTDAAVAELLAKQAIAEALATYARGVDRIDLDLVRSVFHEDAVADYGEMFQGSGWGFADFIGQVHPPMETTGHHLSNVLVTVDGDRAGSESYVIARFRTPDGAGHLLNGVSYGRYVDRWERRDGTWRIVHRRYLHTHDEFWPTATLGFPTTGERSPADPSYDVLGGRA
jgi:ketosteroid isomerase-like protein